MKCFMIAAALLAAASPLAFQAPAAAAASQQGSSRFSVVTEGKGPDVIFIPGLMSSRDVWSGTVAALAGKYRVHLVQIGGFASEPAGANGEGRILPGVVEDLHAYIRGNRLKAPAVVGHSMGGLLALMLAEAHPEDVGRVMVVDSLPFAAQMFSPNPSIADIEPQAAGFRAHVAGAADDAFRAEETATMAALVSGDEDRRRLLDWAMQSDRKIGGEAMYEILTTDARPALAQLKVPLTVVYAAGTNAAGADSQPVFTRAYSPDPEAKLVPVSDSRHFIMLDQPQRFHNALAEFLGANVR